MVFDFHLGRGRGGPRQFLGQCEGILQTDQYVGYDQIGGPRMVHAGLWAHVRRHRRNRSNSSDETWGTNCPSPRLEDRMAQRSVSLRFYIQ